MIASLLACGLMVMQAFSDGMNKNAHPLIKMVTSTTDTTAGGCSYTTGTLPISGRAYIYSNPSVNGKATIAASEVTARGFGLTDTAHIVLKTSRLGEERTLDSVRCIGLPCTLTVAIDSTMDTLIWHDIFLWYKVLDSLSDSALTAYYHSKYEFNVKGQ